MILILDEGIQLGLKKSHTHLGRYKVSFERTIVNAKVAGVHVNLHRITHIPCIEVYQTYKEYARAKGIVEQNESLIDKQDLDFLKQLEAVLKRTPVKEDNVDLKKDLVTYQLRIRQLEQDFKLLSEQLENKGIDVNSLFNVRGKATGDRAKLAIFKKLLDQNLEVRK